MPLEIAAQQSREYRVSFAPDTVVWDETVQLSNFPNFSSALPRVRVVDNHVYIVWVSTASAESYFVRSTDFGATWSSPHILANNGEWFQSSSTFAVSGPTLFFVARYRPPPFITNTWLQKSTDNGANWQPGEVVMGVTPKIDGLSAFRDDICLNFDSTSGSQSPVWFGYSPDHGVSWVPFAPVLTRQPTLTIGFVLTTDPWAHRRLHYTREYGSATRPEVSYTFSTDYGATWRPEGFLSPTDSILSDGPHLAADTSGFVAVAWRDGRYVGPSGFGAAIYYRHSTDGGESFQPEQLLSIQHRGLEPKVAVDKITGVVGLAWRDEPSSSLSYIVSRISFDQGNTWSQVYSMNPGSVGISGGPDIAADKDLVHVCWRNQAGATAKIQVYYRRGRILRDSTTVSLGIQRPWRMVSVPVGVADYSVGSVFPTAQTQAFSFDGTAYVPTDTLQPGRGYWIKFDTTQGVSMRGATIVADTIPVVPGWNMVGTISYAVAAGVVATEPPGIIISGFYTTNAQGVYQQSGVLEPGHAYWVKAVQQGTIVLAR